MRIAILTPGILPVPAVKGGAVENLVQEILDENRTDDSLNITVFGLADQSARSAAAEKYPYIDFALFRSGKLAQALDRIIYILVRFIRKNANLISYRYILERLSVIMQYGCILRRKNFDRVILVNNSTLFLIFLFPSVRKKFLKKSTFYLHNEVSKMFGAKRLLPYISSVWGISKFVLDSFDHRFPGIIGVPHYVIKNSLDDHLFSTSHASEVRSLRKKWNCPPEDFVVLFSGRLVYEKGARQLLEATRTLEIPNLKIIVIGGTFYSSDVTSSYMIQLRALAREQNNRVIFTGYIPYEQMPAAYELADVVCLPSMWDEPAGMTMLEAASMGKPLITTRSGGIPEYLSEDRVFMVDRANVVDEVNRDISFIYQHLSSEQDKAQEYAKSLREKYSRRNYYRRFRRLLEVN